MVILSQRIINRILDCTEFHACICIYNATIAGCEYNIISVTTSIVNYKGLPIECNSVGSKLSRDGICRSNINDQKFISGGVIASCQGECCTAQCKITGNRELVET